MNTRYSDHICQLKMINLIQLLNEVPLNVAYRVNAKGLLTLFLVCIRSFHGLIIYPEDGGNMFLWNVTEVIRQHGR
jgi:hypothetical protein